MTQASGSGVVKIFAGAGFALILLLSGYFIYQKVSKPDVPVPRVQTGNAADQPGTIKKPEAADIQPSQVLASAAPKFDLVRVEADGEAVIAGIAQAGKQVQIVLDGQEIGQATADAQGRFVAMLSLPIGRDAQALSLSVNDDSGQVFSEEQVILTPAAPAVPEPVQIAAVAPDEIDVVPTVQDNSEGTIKIEQETQAQTPVQPVKIDEAEQPAIQNVNDVTVADSPVDTSKEASPKIEQPVIPKVAPTVLLASKDGVKVLQVSGSAPAISNVVVDAISYDALGDVQLTGRGSDAGFVRVYLDNTPIQTAVIDQAGVWRLSLPEVDAGVYVLRVDQVDAAGAVISRTETPFKREAAEVLQNAKNNAAPVVSITVQPGATLWAIARDKYGDGVMYTRVFEANRDRIRNPDLIYPGQVFEVPERP